MTHGVENRRHFLDLKFGTDFDFVFSFCSQTFMRRATVQRTRLTKFTAMLSPRIFNITVAGRMEKQDVTVYLDRVLSKINLEIEHVGTLLLCAHTVSGNITTLGQHFKHKMLSQQWIRSSSCWPR